MMVLRRVLDVLALAALSLVYVSTVVLPALPDENTMLDRVAREEWSVCQEVGRPSDEALRAGLTCVMLMAEVERISRR